MTPRALLARLANHPDVIRWVAPGHVTLGRGPSHLIPSNKRTTP